jgi:long-chain fatty acid transport protein
MTISRSERLAVPIVSRENMMRLRLTVAWLALLAGNAQAAGFALIEQNASGLGNAYAGQAAAAEDASTIFFNPAGMTRLGGKQLLAAAHAILPSAKFSDTGSNNAPTQTEFGGNGGDAGTTALVPNVYFTMPLGKGITGGLGISAPFGLVTEYDNTWVGRFHAVKSDLKTININPSLAFKANDAWSVGFGINAQQAKAELSKMANYGALVADSEGLAIVEGDDWGWGYNLGVLFEPRPDVRVGFSYRSKVDYELEGTVTYTNHPALAGC